MRINEKLKLIEFLNCTVRYFGLSRKKLNFRMRFIDLSKCICYTEIDFWNLCIVRCFVMSFETFEELREARMRLKKAHEENNFEGFNKLLYELYPDTAHFIYELLQNAEDMHATVARFILSENAIEFEHNGTKRSFNLADVDAITNIGNNAEKRNDVTAIGKFGIGFKAVFAYTDTPEIHSGDYHFKIEDVYVPTKVKNMRTVDPDGIEWTKFILPFNKANKSASEASSEIMKELESLNDTAILFLKNIKTVEYLLPNADYGYIKLESNKNPLVTIKNKKPHSQEEISQWLRFLQAVEIKDENEAIKKMNIGVAYSLASDKSQKTKYQIVPLKGGHTTFIYFPAEKEYSGLRFNINAPFASTVARDSIIACRENEILIKKIAELAADSIKEIKTMGLLDMNFLAVLPNSRDDIRAPYLPIRERIFELFNEEELIPTKSGGYANAESALIGSNAISNLFDEESLEILTGKIKKWIRNASQKNGLADQFIESLNIEHFETRDFFDLFRSVYESKEENDLFEIYLAHQSDKKLKSFYLVCEDLYNKSSWTDRKDYDGYESRMRGCKMIRDMNNEMQYPRKVFIFNGVSSKEDGPFVKDCFIGKNNKTRTQEEEKIKNFFAEELGVREYDFEAKAEAALKRIRNIESSEADYYTEKYFKDLLTVAKGGRDIEGIKDYELFFCNKEELFPLLPADKIFLGSSYGNETGDIMAELMDDVYCLWDGYKEKYSEKELRCVLNFAKYCGVKRNITIEEQSAYENPLYREKLSSESRFTGYGKDEDYTIWRLEYLLSLKDLRISKMIWDILLEKVHSYINYAEAVYSPNGSATPKHCESSLIYYLKRNDWVPDINGRLFKPGDIDIDKINKSFKYDDRNKLLKALGFGSAQSLCENFQTKVNEFNDMMSKNGYDEEWERVTSDEKELLKQYRKNKKSEKKYLQTQSLSLEKMLAKQTRIEKDGSTKLTDEAFIVRSTSSTLKDIEKTILNNEKMPGRIVKYFRKIDTSSKEERAVLMRWYNGKCQMCGARIIKYDKTPYFEAKNIINTQDVSWKLDKSIPLGWNSVCLCPNCAVRYSVCTKDITTLYNQIMSRKVYENQESPVQLAIQLDGGVQYIKYAPDHFRVLQEVCLWLDKMDKDSEIES